MIEEAIEKLATLLQGKIPAKIETETIANEEQRKLANMLNQLFGFMHETHEFIVPLSRGDLHEVSMQPKNFLGSPFKELHSRLRHLTWQAKQVAKGDYDQRVDFMGEFSEAFNTMIIALDNNEKLLKRKIDELENALSTIKTLEGFLPICASCKKIRVDDANPKDQKSWSQIEAFLTKKTDAQFTHTICPECMKKLYPDFHNDSHP
ncbi:MAG: hypothetical protein U9N63_07660 [Pseudomonadota bacterium]|nr:hypothetical protein [Pseudomonadota bacterium]